MEIKFKKLIKLLNTIEPEKDYSDSHWKFYFKINSKEWEKLSITLYDKNYYFTFAGSRFTMCYPGEKEKVYWNEPEIKWILQGVNSCINEIKTNLELYYRKLHKELPLKYREGLIPRKALMLNVKVLYRPEKKLGKKLTANIVRWIEINGSKKNKTQKPLTLKIYLEYCRVAYMANAKSLGIDDSESGMMLYKRFADNRHEGLLDIDINSPEAFNKWYHGPRGGGHPWEIYRGGNTTHIDLGAHEYNEYSYKYTQEKEQNNEYEIFLNGFSTGRLVETIRIALAFIEKDMPFTLSNAEGIRKKLLGLDNLGIIPEWYSTHRANQSYPEGLDVYDCIKFQDPTPAERKKLLPYITWLPLDIILPHA
jgi:hypothetical protein